MEEDPGITRVVLLVACAGPGVVGVRSSGGWGVGLIWGPRMWGGTGTTPGVVVRACWGGGWRNIGAEEVPVRLPKLSGIDVER
jgi:hypothetical protein